MMPECPQPAENVVEPLDAAAEETLHVPDAIGDHTEIDVNPAGVRPVRRPPAPAIRLGKVTVPVLAAAWGLSLLIHAVAIGGVALVAWLYFAPPRPLWGGGGGASGGLVESSSPVVSTQSPLPNVGPPAPASKSAAHDSAMDAETDTTPAWNQKRTSVDLIEPEFASPMLGVGITSGVEQVPRRRGKASRPPGVVAHSVDPAASNVPPSSAGNAGSSADYTSPGLPGALMGRGPPSPDYPIEARRRGQQGTVKIEFEVLPDGRLGRIRVASDPGFPLLRDAALTAARKLRDYDGFQPARYLGRPVRGTFVIPYHFSLR